MNKNPPTMRSRELGNRLRDVLTATGIGQKAMASRLGRSPDYVSRLLNGRMECDEVEVAAQMPRANTSRMDRWSMVHEGCFSMLGSGTLREFFVPEWVLRTPVGGTEVMSEQLHHLLRLSFWSTISLRLLPTAASSPIGLGGGFTLLEFADLRPAVHRETETMSVVAMGEVEVAACRAVVERLCDAACDERRSRELIGQVASELYGPERAQPDDS